MRMECADYHKPRLFWLPRVLMPTTATHPTAMTVTAMRNSLKALITEGVKLMVWMWLIAPECSAARAKDSIFLEASELVRTEMIQGTSWLSRDSI